MEREREHKVISFTNFIYCMEKRLGLDGVQVTEKGYKYLDMKHPGATFARNIPLEDALELKEQFVTQVVGKLNEIQMASFERNFDEAIKAGGDNFADFRIGDRYDTGCKTVVMGCRRRRMGVISYNK